MTPLDRKDGPNYEAFDRPEILLSLFYPRPEWNYSLLPGGPVALSIPVGDGAAVGAYFHEASPSSATVLFFHGNGEIAADYNDVASFFKGRQINLLVADYRGYGRSSGQPSVESLMKDAHAVFEFAVQWLADNGFTGPLVVMGRSLGSAPALELVASRGKQIGGLIIESGFAYIDPLLALMGVNMASLGINEDRSFRNTEKIRSFCKPTLVLHAQFDHIIAIAEGRALYENSPAGSKKFVEIVGANHNNIFVAGLNEYMAAIEWLIRKVEKGDE